ncbi:hypothetical protein [Paenibacillus endoradicis]|uniref:hypothetical protein n=1 Tax=Paenibacillus endoradicis TaxID=2972487 RepID=UPI0021590779|nr:hypothetical protein [Paenibacillus endoradicis]MCR8656947.1 hypothetical protein [Paenibacillus endoradicis]
MFHEIIESKNSRSIVNITNNQTFDEGVLTSTTKWEITIDVRESRGKATCLDERVRFQANIDWVELKSNHLLDEMIGVCKSHSINHF